MRKVRIQVGRNQWTLIRGHFIPGRRRRSGHGDRAFRRLLILWLRKSPVTKPQLRVSVHG